eukprot:PhF_6_TR11740/c1_g1_i3/m.19194
MIHEHLMTAPFIEERQEYVQRVIDMFNEVDLNKDGSISLDEFIAAASTVCPPNTSHEKLKDLWNAADRNHDGKLDLNEFMAIVSTQLHPRERRALASLSISNVLEQMVSPTKTTKGVQLANRIVSPTKQTSPMKSNSESNATNGSCESGGGGGVQKSPRSAPIVGRNKDTIERILSLLKQRHPEGLYDFTGGDLHKSLTTDKLETLFGFLDEDESLVPRRIAWHSPVEQNGLLCEHITVINEHCFCT